MVVSAQFRTDFDVHCVLLHERAKFATYVFPKQAPMNGVLFKPQQSIYSSDPSSDLNPAGQAVQVAAVVTFENVSAAHGRHGPELGVGLNEPFGQDAQTELFVPFGAYGAYP